MFFCWFYIVSLFFLAITRHLSDTRRNVQGRLVMDDAFLLLWLCLAIAGFRLIHWAPVQVVLWVCATGALLFVWLESVVYREYTLNLTADHASIFFQNRNHFGREAREVGRCIVRTPAFILYPPLAVLTMIQIFFAPHTLIWTVPALVALAYFTVQHASARTIALSSLIVLALTAGVEAVLVLLNASEWDWLTADEGWTFASIALSIVVVAFGAARRFIPHPFFLSESPFRDRIRPPKQRAISADRIRPDDRVHIEIPERIWKPSDQFGRLKGANIILVMVESLSSSYVQPHATGGVGTEAQLPMFDRLSSNGVKSKMHCCISPNTNHAIHVTYSGRYYQKPVSYPYLTELIKHGYRAQMVTSQNTRGFGFIDLLKNVGYDHVIDVNNIDSVPMKPNDILIHNDYRFFERAADFLESKLDRGEKHFIHILTSQTHEPYSVYYQDASEDPAERYLQAVEETDRNIAAFLSRLGRMIPLSNAIIIYTGDHGQSFGELGYKAHSHGITKEQINVPFTLFHPALPKRSVERSTHFDVFPTLLDLLGVRSEHPCIGQSLFTDPIPTSHVLFSKTRTGVLPTSYGLIHGDTKILYDHAHRLYLKMDLQDRIQTTLTGDEREYYADLLYLCLEKRGLVY